MNIKDIADLIFSVSFTAMVAFIILHKVHEKRQKAERRRLVKEIDSALDQLSYSPDFEERVKTIVYENYKVKQHN